MNIDVAKIEHNIYEKICMEFADYCESKLQIYQTVFSFFSSITLEEFITLPNNEIYQKYTDFCKNQKFEPLKNTVFSQIVCRCGFHCFRTTRLGKKTIYYELD